MHAGIWETIADALFWLQLCWVFSGFLLMAYLAFKVFPTPAKPIQSDGMAALHVDDGLQKSRSESAGSKQLLTGMNSNLGSLQLRGRSTELAEFRNTISRHRRQS